METKVTEKLIAHIWQQKLVTELATTAGERINVIHPGRSSNTSGCDFQDAVFILNGEKITGNIEVHVKSSQWHSHGHHRDLKYNSIDLHIVWWHDSRVPILLQSGKTVPTICLSSFINRTLDDLNKGINQSGNPLACCPAISKDTNIASLNRLLTAAGEERFAAKADAFRQALNKEDAGQVLYRGIARALGYAQNAEPCEELANRLPINIIDGIKHQADSATRQALILGVAGLLPSQRHRLVRDSEADKLETIWQSIHTAETMQESNWCFFRVRPDNFPTRRLIALSHLISQYGKKGLLQETLKLIRKSPLGAEHRWLGNSLVISGQGYWANHFDFGIAQKRCSALLGRERASAISINTILPFACAWGELNTDLKLKKKAAEVYHGYPQTGDNELTRYMKQQLRLKQEVRLSACQQQGLIHIFKTCCRHRTCAECPISINQG